MKRYAGIMANDIVDGEGTCVSFWTQGCPHHCNKCHNPGTWDFSKGLELPDDYVEKVIKLIHKNGVKRNLSILGGEPFAKENQDIVYNLISKVRESLPEINIYIWSGYTYEELTKGIYLSNKILELCDIVVDGKYEDSKRNLNLFLRGSSNQRVIDIKKSLEKGTIILYHE